MTFIRKALLLFPFLFVVTSNADVQQIKEVPKVRLTKLMKSLVQTQKYSLANIKISPENPQLGDTVTAYVELTTELEGVTKIRPFIKVNLNGNEIKSLNRFGTVWVVEPFQVNHEGEYKIDVEVFVEDLKASQEARDSLLELEKDIQWLLVEIENERDLARKAYLQNSLNSKLSWKNSLTDTLNSLRRLVTTQSKKIQIGSVVPNPPDENEPVVNDCTPNHGFLDGGYVVTVTGTNLENTSSIAFGGVVIDKTLLQVSSTSISFTAPVLPMGMHNLKVNTLIDEVAESKTFKNVFFALQKVEITPDPEPTEPMDLRPVAFAGVPKNMESGESIQLNGSLSYDEYGKNLTYLWTVISKPFGALATDGVLTNPNTVSPDFFAVTSGSYVIALTVNNGDHDSIPSLITIGVGAVDDIVVSPKEIVGQAASGDMYVGMFTMCNNTGVHSSYQLLGSGYSIISGSRKGNLNSKSCLPIQFGIAYSGWETKKVSIPILVSGNERKHHIVEITIDRADTSQVSLWINYEKDRYDDPYSDNFYLGYNTDELSKDHTIVVKGVYDAQSTTVLKVRNESFFTLNISSPPALTHLGGMSGVFSVVFPAEGLSICSRCVVSLPVVVTPGNFNTAKVAEAIFDWDIGTGANKVLILRTHMLSRPDFYVTEIDFGTVSKANEFLYYPDLVKDFFWTPPVGIYSIYDYSTNSLDRFGATLTLPSTFGSVDYYNNYKVPLSLRFFSTLREGYFEESLKVHVAGFSTPFEYILKVNIVP